MNKVKRIHSIAVKSAKLKGLSLSEFLKEERRFLEEKLFSDLDNGIISEKETEEIIAMNNQREKEILNYSANHNNILSSANFTIAEAKSTIRNKQVIVKYKTMDKIYSIRRLIRRKLGHKEEFKDMVQRISKDILKQEMEDKCQYVCSDEIAMCIWMALNLNKPLLVEGPPGCGKTEIAKALATIFETDLVRLQCYEGMDETKALYEWNYQRQILDIQAGKTNNVFGEDYLLERPLLKALRANKVPVLLIDEIDKTDQEFEAFLLEILSDFQVSIPELGTISAKTIPPVILTSNAVRDIGDALRRRCVYLWIEYPTVDKEAAILMRKTRMLNPRVALDIARCMFTIRAELPLLKYPSVSESLDLAQTMVDMKCPKLDPPLFNQLSTLFIKNKDDLDKLKGKGGGEWALKNI